MADHSYKVDRDHHDPRSHPRALRRTAHQGVEQETLYGMRENTVDSASCFSRFGGHVGKRSTVQRTLDESTSSDECFTDRCSGETGQRHPARSDLVEELPTTCEPSASRGDRVVRRLRFRRRSPTNGLVDSRLPILAQSDQFQSQELGADRQRVEAIGPFVSRTCRSGPSGGRYHSIGHQRR